MAPADAVQGGGHAGLPTDRVQWLGSSTWPGAAQRDADSDHTLSSRGSRRAHLLPEAEGAAPVTGGPQSRRPALRPELNSHQLVD